MESKRQQKISRLLQKEMGQLFQRELKDIIGQSFVTVTIVRITPDLGLARVYLSMLMVPDTAALIEQIRSQTSRIRGVLGNKVRNQLRIIPELEFFVDDTAESAAQIDKIIGDLEIPEDDKLNRDDYEKLDD